MERPSLDDVAAFVREFAALPTRRALLPETKLDADLGITGDDGVELLDHAERRFDVALRSPALFGLRPGEVLFGAEGFDPLGISVLLRWLLREPRFVVRDLTLEELHRAIREAPPLSSVGAA